MFEKVINELRNIEYALNYWISISQKNKRKRFSRIQSNDSIHLKNFSQPKASLSPNVGTSPEATPVLKPKSSKDLYNTNTLQPIIE